MAKLTFLLAIIAAVLVFLMLNKVQGRTPNKSFQRKGQGREKQNGYQNNRTGKTKNHRNKQRDQSQKRLHGYYWNPSQDFFISYHDMTPPAFFNFRWNMEASREQPWWQGPHVCENESEEMFNNAGSRNEILRHFSTNSQVCDVSETVYKCKIVQKNIDGRRELTIVYECCQGYARKKGDFGCPEKVSLLSLLEKGKELGLTDFVASITALNLTKDFEKGNLTVFMPVNYLSNTPDSDLQNAKTTDSFQQDGPNVASDKNRAVSKGLMSARNAIFSHVVVGTVRTSNMEDEQVLKSGIMEDSAIRINYFSRPDKLMTANCVPVVSRDNMATNGVIHTVEKVLKPVIKSLLDIVTSRQDLSSLKTVLAAANYVSSLDQNGQLTLLAPTNSAFNKMNKRLRDKLLNGDRQCLERVLQNHLLPNVICSVAIQGQARTANQLHRYVNITRTEDKKLFVNGAQIIESDVMATNGVMHVIDEVLVPDEALSILDLMKKGEHSEMLRLIEKAGLTKTLESATNMTVFVPTNKAFQSLPVAVKTKLNEDFELLRDVVTFHLSPGIQGCHRVYDNQLIPTLATESIRFNSYSTFPYYHHVVKTAQCASISDMNIDACNGRINIINSLLIPPKGNVVDVLALDKRFSTFVSLVKKSGIADDLQEDGPFTVIAPNNEVFEKAGQNTVDSISKPPGELQKFVKRHIIQGTLCCAGISRHNWLDRSQIITMSGEQVKLSRDHFNRPKIGQAVVTRCDLTATNGNVLEIDRFLPHEPPRHPWRFSPYTY